MLYKPAKVTPVGTDGGAQLRRVRQRRRRGPAQPALARAGVPRRTRPAARSSSAPTTSRARAAPATRRTPATARATATGAHERGDSCSPTGSQSTRPAPATRDVLIVGDLTRTRRRTRSPRSKRPASPTSIAHSIGPDAYSYVFDGQWGYLDHALGSASLVPQVTGVGDWHINADEPSVLDYNTDFKTPGQLDSLYAPDQFRISDHDPVVVGLNLPVTFDSLCVLDELFVDSTDVEHSLCNKLADAKAAAESGKTKTKQTDPRRVREPGRGAVRQVHDHGGGGNADRASPELCRQITGERKGDEDEKGNPGARGARASDRRGAVGARGGRPPKPPKPPKLTTVKLLAFNDFHGHLEAGHAGDDPSEPRDRRLGRCPPAAPSTSPRT